MAFVLDPQGNLHNNGNERAECDLDKWRARSILVTYSTGQDAFDAQQADIAADTPPTIQHFCSFCMPGVSWEEVVTA